jgi:FKBP-type peptidyl-prolyl cis-trans isomerase
MFTTLARLSLFLLAASSALASNEAGKKFLADNAHKDGVVVLPSGLQYKVLSAGSGDAGATLAPAGDVNGDGVDE